MSQPNTPPDPPGLLSDVVRAFRLVSFGRRVAIVLAMLLISFADLIGLGMILPFILVIARPGQDPTAVVPGLHYIGAMLEAAGLPHSLGVFFFFFAGVLVFKSACSIVLTHYTAATVAQLTVSLRTRLASSLLDSEWSFLSRQRTGVLSGMVSHEVNAVGQAFSDVASLAAMSLQILFYLTIAFLLSWQVALFAMLILAVVVSFFNVIVSYRSKVVQLQLAATNQLAALFSEVVSSVKVFRGMGRVSSVLASVRKTALVTSERLSHRIASSELSAEILEPLVGLLVIGWFYASLYWYDLVLANVLVIGVLLIRVIYLYLTFYRALFRINEGRAQLRGILELLDRATEAQEVRSGRGAVPPHFNISIESLAFSYGPAPVLESFTLKVPFGSIVAISGPSGSGKTTLLDLMLGLRLPRAGHILIDGRSLFSDIDMLSWRRQIGYVPQEQVLLNASIFENLTFGESDLRREDAERALACADALGFVMQLPGTLDYVVGERGQFLSGGQRQRIAIARALIRRPSLLILDEATTALDPQTEGRIIFNIGALHAERPFTIFSVSHQDGWSSLAHQHVEFGRESVLV